MYTVVGGERKKYKKKIKDNNSLTNLRDIRRD